MYFAFTMKTTVTYEAPKYYDDLLEPLGTETREVNNIGLIKDQRNLVILAGILFLVGAGFTIAGSVTESKGAGRVKCEKCAELVQKDASVCRYCGAERSVAKAMTPSGINERLPNGMISCGKCEVSNRADRSTCIKCGHDLALREDEASEGQDKSLKTDEQWAIEALSSGSEIDAEQLKEIVAICSDHPEVLSQKHGQSGNSLLHLAAELGCIDCARQLIKLGMPADVENNQGHTPVLLATDSSVASFLQKAAWS